MVREYKTLNFSQKIFDIEENTIAIIPGIFCFSIFNKEPKITAELADVINDCGYEYHIFDRNVIPTDIISECSTFRKTAIIPLYRPDEDSYTYHLTILDDDACESVKALIKKHETLKEDTYLSALVNFAYNEPELFEHLILSNICPAVEGVECYKEIQESPIFRGRRPVPKNDLVSLKEMSALMKRFLHNVKKYKETNDEKAKAEIEIILKNSVGITDEQWKMIFSPFTKDSTKKDVFNVCIDRFSLGKRASTKIKVKKESNQNLRENHGRYFVTLQYESDKGTKEVVVDFKNQPTAVVYIMYLIDRKQKGNKVERIDLQNNMKEFTRLYNLIYGDYIAPGRIESHLKNIITEEVVENGKVTLKTGRLKLYYEDISAVIDTKMVKTENPLPYKVNARTHLTIPKENIELPEELMDFKFK